MARSLNESKTDKVKRHLEGVRDRWAKITGAKRMLASKTDKIADGDIKDYILFAKEIEGLAHSIKYTALEKIARQYKMEMKKIYEEYKRLCKDLIPDSDDATKYRKECLARVAAIAMSLVNVVFIQARNMRTIYDKAYAITPKIQKIIPSPGQKIEETPKSFPPNSNLQAPHYAQPPSAPPYST